MASNLLDCAQIYNRVAYIFSKSARLLFRRWVALFLTSQLDFATQSS
jgi:hypothetical protein